MLQVLPIMIVNVFFWKSTCWRHLSLCSRHQNRAGFLCKTNWLHD